MDFRNFLAKASQDPELLKRAVADPDATAKDMSLDNQAATRLRLLGDAVERITLNTPHDIARVASSLRRGLGHGNAAWTDQYSDSHTDQWTDHYSDDGPEELADMFGVGRRTPITPLGPRVSPHFNPNMPGGGLGGGAGE